MDHIDFSPLERVKSFVRINSFIYINAEEILDIILYAIRINQFAIVEYLFDAHVAQKRDLHEFVMAMYKAMVDHKLKHTGLIGLNKLAQVIHGNSKKFEKKLRHYVAHCNSDIVHTYSVYDKMMQYATYETYYKKFDLYICEYIFRDQWRRVSRIDTENHLFNTNFLTIVMANIYTTYFDMVFYEYDPKNARELNRKAALMYVFRRELIEYITNYVDLINKNPKKQKKFNPKISQMPYMYSLRFFMQTLNQTNRYTELSHLQQENLKRAQNQINYDLCDYMKLLVKDFLEPYMHKYDVEEIYQQYIDDGENYLKGVDKNNVENVKVIAYLMDGVKSLPRVPKKLPFTRDLLDIYHIRSHRIVPETKITVNDNKFLIMSIVTVAAAAIIFLLL
ncbi:hypothetical protein SlGVgp123 [Spodoptera litura granulovirus]|uniref:Uncharacterized protein n=1 Tax=Spodoptera litura granulovirus TaxID=359919 RepID=A5IZX5_9BBAC|nr:hypothetical protein SlGVgp123 [Spodoptera litura granulovirus]ABQ52066.1 hypothetical protein SlGVgp123 [Spodoptera litura granulovirus]